MHYKIKKYKKKKSIIIPILLIIAISFPITIFKFNLFNIENPTLNIYFSPKISENVDKTQKIEIDGSELYSDLIFKTSIEKESFKINNPDIVYSFTMENVTKSMGERFNETNIHERGTMEIWMKPDWIGDDNAAHYFIDIGENIERNRITLFKDKDNYLKFRILDKEGKKSVVKKYVGNEVKNHEIGLNWKTDDWYRLAASWNLKEKRLKLYVNNLLIENKKFENILFDFNKPTTLLLGNGLEIREDSEWGKTNCKDFNEICSFTLDEFLLWKSEREITQLLSTQFVSQYLSQIIDFKTSVEFLSIEIENKNPEGTFITTHVRSSEDTSEWSNWNVATKEGGILKLDVPNGRFFQIEFVLDKKDIEKEINLDDIINLKVSIKN